MNLLKETVEILKENKKSAVDIYFISIYDKKKEQKTYLTWYDFLKISDIEYDSNSGSVNINRSIKIVGKDWWLERREYDGSEWWAFCKLPTKPEIFNPPQNLLEE